MKKFKKFLVITLVASLTFVGFGLLWSSAALAASVPPLGTMANFSVLGFANITSANITTISNNLGIWSGTASLLAQPGNWTHTGGSNYFSDSPSPNQFISRDAQADALIAFNNLTLQTTSGGWGVTPWSPVPGVWTVAGDETFTGTITLNGSYDDVWVFQISTDFVFSGSVVLAGNAQACNVFWSVTGDATIASGSNFVGTLIAQNDITSASGATINGRLISLSGTTIAMNGANSSITGPTCVAAPSGSTTQYGTINVVKVVINDNGGTKVIGDFPLFVNGNFIASGITNRFGASRRQAYEYKVTETADTHYTRTFSGDCDANGIVMLNPNENKFCIITNNDIGAPVIAPPVPPIIDVVKVPSPLSLPNGPGLVNYTYTLRNIGTVPVTDITMVGDTCSPIILATGDTNADAKLDLNETWVYRCSTTLSETHTNTVVATGWANGLSAVDIASATVIVGAPIVPPLIHVTKVPSPLALLAGGGIVTYTEKITNPGTVALSNVKLVDDKCAPMKYISGDTNGDSKLDSSETWTYTCKSNLTKTTTNTAVASGEANGLTVRDFAIATVVVASIVPSLPNTGFTSGGISILGIIMLAGALSLFSALAIMVRRKNKI